VLAPVAETAAEAAPAKPPRARVDPADIAAAAAPESDIDPLDPAPPAPPAEAGFEARVIDAMKTVRDPEIPVNLIDLGLIYDLDIRADGSVSIEMSLTAPSCPSAAELPAQIEHAVRGVDGVGEVTVKVVWEPPWTPDRMSEEARLELGFM
jgi:FeS assembly SUF system protein